MKIIVVTIENIEISCRLFINQQLNLKKKQVSHGTFTLSSNIIEWLQNLLINIDSDLFIIKFRKTLRVFLAQ